MYRVHIVRNPCQYQWSLKESSAITKEEKDQIFSLYKQRPLFPPINSENVLFSYYPCSFYVCCSLESNKIEAALLFWRHPHGNKIGTSVASNATVYKSELLPKYTEILQKKGFFAELSGPLEYLLRTRFGLDNIKDVVTIKKLVGVSADDIFAEDDPRRQQYMLNEKHNMLAPVGSYLRNISGIREPHRKALYGTMCEHYDRDDCARLCTD